MTLQYNFLDEISPTKETWRVKVRIIRTWRRATFSNPDDCIAIDMVLMDEKGKKIEATVWKPLVKKYSAQIVEGQLRTITNFDVGENSGDYRATKHPFKIIFLRSTSVKECDNLSIPFHGFTFIPFDNILSNRQEGKFLIDVIGEVAGVSSIQVSNKDGKQLRRVEIELEDLEKKKVKCTLWEDYAEQLSSYVAEGHSLPIVLIIQFARIKIWRDEVTLTNAIHSTRLFINGDITEIMEFKQRLGNNRESSTLKLIQLPTHSRNSTSDEFFRYERKFVAEIRDIQTKCSIVTLATIMCIQTENNWFYPSCSKCSKKVEKDDKSEYYCKKCDTHVNCFIPRYKVQVRVCDETGSASFVIFEPIVAAILNKSASDLRESLVKTEDIDAFPKELDFFWGKKYVFVVEISDYNILKPWNIYTVLRMSDDEALMDKFKSSPAAIHDSTSYTGENEIQSGSYLSSPSRKRSSEGTLVHALENAGDGEDVAIQSSTTKKIVRVKVERDEN